MKLIGLESLLSVAKDVTLANGAKHRCIDATEVYELPTIDIVRCKNCKHYRPKRIFECGLHGSCQPKPDWFCADGERKEGDIDG